MSCAAASLPAAAMGMNVPHGLEESGWSHWRFFCHLARYGCHRCRSLGRHRQSKSTLSRRRRRQTRKTRARVKALRHVLVNFDNLDDVLRDDITHGCCTFSRTTHDDKSRTRVERNPIVGDGAATTIVDLVFEVFDKIETGKFQLENGLAV